MDKSEKSYTTLKILIIILLLIGAYFLIYNNTSKFSGGDCVKDYRDGYIWIVNDFSNGNYYLMGWQGNAWGNRVSMGKDTLERLDYPTNKPVYQKTSCPEYSK